MRAKTEALDPVHSSTWQTVCGDLLKSGGWATVILRGGAEFVGIPHDPYSSQVVLLLCLVHQDISLSGDFVVIDWSEIAAIKVRLP